MRFRTIALLLCSAVLGAADPVGIAAPAQASSAGGLRLYGGTATAMGIQAAGGINLRAGLLMPVVRQSPVDATPPRIVLGLSATRITLGQVVTLTISVDEPVRSVDLRTLAFTGLVPVDVVAFDAARQSVAIRFRSVRIGTSQFTLPAGVFVDLAGNPSAVANSELLTVDPPAPAAPEPVHLSSIGVSGSILVGERVPVLAIDGQGNAYRFTATNATVQPAAVMDGSTDLDADGDLDPGCLATVVAAGPGPVTVTVTDATGSATVSLTAVASPVAADADKVIADGGRVPTSSRTQAFYGAICMGSPEGQSRLLNLLRGNLDAAQLRAFSWDAADQIMREIPGELGSAGLAATDGVYLATRLNLDLDFAGTTLPATRLSLVLQPGWNFVGLPLITDATGNLLAQIPLADLVLTDVLDQPYASADRAAILGLGAYAWNGSDYQLVQVLEAGKAYWIANRTDPGSVCLLRGRATGSIPALRSAVRAIGPVPVHPGSSAVGGGATTQAEPGGGCGSGGGMALVLGSLVFVALARRRRPTG